MVSTTPRRGGLIADLARNPYRYAAITLAFTLALVFIWDAHVGKGGGAQTMFAINGASSRLLGLAGRIGRSA